MAWVHWVSCDLEGGRGREKWVGRQKGGTKQLVSLLFFNNLSNTLQIRMGMQILGRGLLALSLPGVKIQLMLNYKSAIQVVLLRFRVSQNRLISVDFSHNSRDFGFVSVYFSAVRLHFLQSYQVITYWFTSKRTPYKMRRK